MTKHITVLKNETIDLLNPRDGGVYIDATFGGGGHSLETLSRVGAKILAFDSDVKNIENFQKEHNRSDIVLLNRNFAELKSVLKDNNIELVDGIVADLGWSSDQLENIMGLSYQNIHDELDMRFHKEILVQAKDILNTAGKAELSDMFARYADFVGPENDKLVNEIREFRSRRLFATVKDLVEVCDRAFGLKKIQSKSRKHTVYGRVFQALRIKLNQEYDNLERFLVDGFDVLKSGGRICIITFHSGEEKLVEQFINITTRKNLSKTISYSIEGSFLRPSVDELTQNLRSRSAKLYVLEKL